jgi:phage tail-like protein
MAEKSSYLRYLPPVLWANEPSAPAFSLGTTLRIFEKILTGIEDDVTIQHGNHTHEPITAVVARLSRLFDPWQTPSSFLPWLASWVALAFPTLQGQPLWDEYQQRKVTSEITQIYRLRGLKAGLNQYLDLYAVGQTRPRVTLDDGSRLLVTSPQPGQMAPVTALVSQGPVVSGSAVLAEGLVQPWCVAAAPDGSLFVGDTGVPTSVPLSLRSRVWRISAAGHYDLAGTPPRPQPLAPNTTPPLTQVVALAVRPPQAGQPETLYILDRPGRLYALPTPYTGTQAALVTSLAVANTTLWPVAMAVDTNGDLLVLDRGDGPGTPNPPKIITVRPNPLAVARKSLQQVIEPLSLLVQPDGKLIVGDGREQEPAQPAQLAGNLVRVDRSNAANWTETVLLPASNPLVAPTAVIRRDDTHFYVLDAGLKPFEPPIADPFILTVAEPAGVYRIDLGTNPPTLTRVTQAGYLVYPTGMAANGGRLLICDPGQPEVRNLASVWWKQPVVSRLLPFRFGVVVHFADSRLPSDPDARTNVLRQVVGNIQSIVEQQKPVHTLWNLITAI